MEFFASLVFPRSCVVNTAIKRLPAIKDVLTVLLCQVSRILLQKMTFYNKLDHIWKLNNSLVCVGLDPDLDRMPVHFQGQDNPIFAFLREIIAATADLVCAFKPQIAYFSGQGAEDQLWLTMSYLKERHPEIPVILDAKRGDIGSTAAMYAREAFDRYGADAVTVNPYLGGDSLEPFLERSGKGVFILCRTSNPGGMELQNLEVDGRKIYQIVAEKAACHWNGNRNVGLVAGATYPRELAQIREAVGDMPLLVPGVGAQGGDIGQVVEAGLNSRGTGMIINSSRGILYAGNDRNFARAARAETIKLRDAINLHRPI